MEVSIAGKLRSERAHFEKHSSGVVPKSGDVAERIVKSSISHVSTKMGLMGIQIRIAIKNEVPQEFELLIQLSNNKNSATLPTMDDTGSSIPPQETVLTEKTETRGPTEVKTNGQS